MLKIIKKEVVERMKSGNHRMQITAEINVPFTIKHDKCVIPMPHLRRGYLKSLVVRQEGPDIVEVTGTVIYREWQDGRE